MDTTTNREEILANFQACTGIDDVAEAILHLDEAKWDFLAAINLVMPQDTQTLPSELGSDVEVIEQIGPRVGSFLSRQQIVPLPNGLPVSLGADFALPSTSHLSASSIYNFSIQQGETIIRIKLLDTATVNDLKMFIFSQLGVPVCQQVLTGWKSEPKSLSTKLGSLNLPKDNYLYLTSLDVDNNGMEVDVVSLSYALTILDETRCKDYNVKYPGSQTVGGVKSDVHSLTDIPVRLQLWSGWPQGITDATTLAQAGLNRPVHDLSVRRSAKKEYKRIVVEVVESDSSVEEFEDASESLMGEDEMFVEEISSKRPQPLIPDNVEDETAGCIHFSDEFTNRYGAAHPDFFTGTLDEAIREACMKPAKERRLMAVYLHHDASVLTNVFCTQLLCFESVLQCLATNFVVWGWDLTFESNRAKFLSSLTLNLGPLAAMTVRNIETERLPALIIIMRMRSSTEVFTVVHGNVGVSELLTSLIQSVDVFTEQQRLEVREEEERMAREMIKIEQDQAYQESLQIDRAKEELRRQQEKAETQEKRRVEREKQEVDAKKEAQRKALQSELPEEPEESITNGITKIRFRLPKGEFLERRFHACDQLRVLLNFLVVQGYPMEDFKVISSWPRRDLTMLDSGSTLEALNLCPQETLILEER